MYWDTVICPLSLSINIISLYNNRAKELGFGGIIWNFYHKGKIFNNKDSTQNKNNINNNIQSAQSQNQLLLKELETVCKSSLDIEYLTRLTIFLESESDFASINRGNSYLSNYDIISVIVNSESLFHLSCSSDIIDIIQFPCDSKLNFYIKRPPIHLSKEQQILFEFSYSPCLKDEGNKKHLFANTGQLLRLIKHKQLLLSSAANNINEMRSAEDLINLAVSMGLNNYQAKEIISSNITRLIAHAKARKTCKGIIKQINSNKHLKQLHADANDNSNNERKENNFNINDNPMISSTSSHNKVSDEDSDISLD